jgi:hypothetical protein
MLSKTHHQTTSYHPESNSAVKRLHRCRKDALHARTAGATVAKGIPWVLLGLRAQPREDIGLSLAKAVFNALIVLPNYFCNETKFLLKQFQKNFQNLWILLRFLCLDTI